MSLVLPAVVYGEGCRTALKAAIRWQGSHELFLPFQNIYFEQLPHFVFRREKFRSWQQLRRGDFDYMLRDTYCTGQELAFLWQPAQKRERVCLFFAELAPQRQQKKEKAVVVDGSYRFLLFPLPDHVCINYAASEVRAPKKGHGRVFLCWWEAADGRGRRVSEPSKQIKMEMLPFASRHPCIKASSPSLGSKEGEER